MPRVRRVALLWLALLVTLAPVAAGQGSEYIRARYTKSYDGFYVAAGMIDAHPALEAVPPQAPIGDCYLGDDCYHNGVLWLPHNFGFFTFFTARTGGPAMTSDQRFAARRPDVLVHRTEPLAEDLTASGPMQSSWLPLGDRNPQSFTDIPNAAASDFRTATQRVYRSARAASGITLVVER